MKTLLQNSHKCILNDNILLTLKDIKPYLLNEKVYFLQDFYTGLYKHR